MTGACGRIRIVATVILVGAAGCVSAQIRSGLADMVAFAAGSVRSSETIFPWVDAAMRQLNKTMPSKSNESDIDGKSVACQLRVLCTRRNGNGAKAIEKNVPGLKISDRSASVLAAFDVEQLYDTVVHIEDAFLLTSCMLDIPEGAEESWHVGTPSGGCILFAEARSISVPNGNLSLSLAQGSAEVDGGSRVHTWMRDEHVNLGVGDSYVKVVYAGDDSEHVCVVVFTLISISVHTGMHTSSTRNVEKISTNE